MKKVNNFINFKLIFLKKDKIWAKKRGFSISFVHLIVY